jgi:hypothetical protein
VEDEVVLAGGKALMCIIESDDDVTELVLAVVLPSEFVRDVLELSEPEDELVRVAVMADMTVDVEVVTPPGGYGHQLKLDVLDGTDVTSCRAMLLILRCAIDVCIVIVSTATPALAKAMNTETSITKHCCNVIV